MSRTIRNKNMGYFGHYGSEADYLVKERARNAHRETIWGVEECLRLSSIRYFRIPNERQLHRFHSGHIHRYGPHKNFRKYNQKRDRAHARRQEYKARMAIDIEDIDFYNRCYKKHAGYWD